MDHLGEQTKSGVYKLGWSGPRKPCWESLLEFPTERVWVKQSVASGEASQKEIKWPHREIIASNWTFTVIRQEWHGRWGHQLSSWLSFPWPKFWPPVATTGVFVLWETVCLQAVPKSTMFWMLLAAGCFPLALSQSQGISLPWGQGSWRRPEMNMLMSKTREPSWVPGFNKLQQQMTTYQSSVCSKVHAVEQVCARQTLTSVFWASTMFAKWICSSGNGPSTHKNPVSSLDSVCTSPVEAPVRGGRRHLDGDFASGRHC